MGMPKVREDIEARVKDTGDVMTGTLSIKKGVNFNQLYFYDVNNMGHCIHVGTNTDTDIADFQLQLKTDVGRSLFILRNSKTVGDSPYCFIYNDINGTTTTQTFLTHTNYENYIKGIYLLKPTESISTLTYNIGTWGANVSAHEGQIVWRENFVDTSLTTDSGDIVFWLQKASDTATILNITIDGYFYQNHSHLLLDDSNYKNYALPLTGGTTTGKIIMTGTNDSAVATANSGILLIGDPAGLHLSMDANEIMAKNTSTTTGILYLNNDGGLVQIGSGGLSCKGIITASSTFFADNTIGLRRSGITKGTLPSTTTYWTFNNCDKNGVAYTNALGQFETSLSTAGLTKTYIRARQFVVNTSSSIKTATLYVQCDIDGNMKAGCDAAFYGAVWNDYAEYRLYKEEEIPYGRVVVEVGDDSMRLAEKRLEPGGAIVSDTFGFAIGETDECRLPIAVSGRVLAYPYEGREVFRKNIGRPVCSGPNGTVSIMSDEEYRDFGYLAIGTISAIPEYEVWGTGNVNVDGRVWIQVK